nr:olfactory receptor 52Z1-like [Meriones unguiculatus]
MKVDSSFHNHTGPQDVWYVLFGIPGLEHLHAWIAIPICSMYIVAVIGNVLLIFLIVTERSLHEPMYFSLFMLALADLLLSTATAPKMLAIFWFHSKSISFGSFVSQMFFFHFIFVAESAILLAMAFDRYVAILSTGLDIMLIIISYTMILSTVFQIPSWAARCKALNTCGSHICVILMFYTPAFFSFFAHRFGGKAIPSHMHILVANLYVVVPPMLNPIIYGVKTKQIQDRVVFLFSSLSTWC